ncbi:hypothetical protein BH20ACI3_BH20ACI3_41890 [soil metagenome]
MADDIDTAEIQKLSESDPAKAELILAMGQLLYEEFSERQPKRFKVFVETVMNHLPPRFKIETRLVHDSDWVAGICDDLEGEGSMSLVPDIHDGEWFGFRPA